MSIEQLTRAVPNTDDVATMSPARLILRMKDSGENI